MLSIEMTGSFEGGKSSGGSQIYKHRHGSPGMMVSLRIVRLETVKAGMTTKGKCI